MVELKVITYKLVITVLNISFVKFDNNGDTQDRAREHTHTHSNLLVASFDILVLLVEIKPEFEVKNKQLFNNLRMLAFTEEVTFFLKLKFYSRFLL